MASYLLFSTLTYIATFIAIDAASTEFLRSTTSNSTEDTSNGFYSRTQNLPQRYRDYTGQSINRGYAQRFDSDDEKNITERKRINDTNLEQEKHFDNPRETNKGNGLNNKFAPKLDPKENNRKDNDRTRPKSNQGFLSIDDRNSSEKTHRKNTSEAENGRKDEMERASEVVNGAYDMGSSAADTAMSVTGKVIKGFSENVAAIKKPIVATVTTVGNAQCENVKKLFGVTYRQLNNHQEPDLNQLKLQVKSHSGVKTYDISGAARFIPQDIYNERSHLDKMVIFVHGFTDDPSKASFQNISESFLSEVDCTVMALDGSSLINWLYLRSTTYVRFMGQKLGQVLAAMVKTAAQDPKKIIIVGHSLGAHIAGFTGKTFRQLTGTTIGRISGLDPAGPCFSDVDLNLRLQKQDADFVDVMHTDAGVYGIDEQIGHVDFYVNGGSLQPNCLFETCSHSRAWLYYSESVKNPRAFAAKKCTDWRTFEDDDCGDTEVTYMGYPTPNDVSGKFYLQTSGEPPYGKGEEGLVFDGSKPVAKKVIDAGADVVSGIKNVADKVFG